MMKIRSRMMIVSASLVLQQRWPGRHSHGRATRRVPGHTCSNQKSIDPARRQSINGSVAGQRALLDCHEIAQWNEAELTLIAVAPLGRAVRRWGHSVSKYLIQFAPCSVLVVVTHRKEQNTTDFESLRTAS